MKRDPIRILNLWSWRFQQVIGALYAALTALLAILVACAGHFWEALVALAVAGLVAGGMRWHWKARRLWFP